MHRTTKGHGVRIVTVSVAVLVLALGGCNKQNKTRTAKVVSSTPQTLRVLSEVPEFQLTDQGGSTFDSRQLAGKVWIATFVFTRCTATCPEQSSGFAEMQRRLEDGETTADVHLVSVTVDPEFDTPEVLTSYGQRFAADFQRWHFLTGTREAIWDLSKEGFKLPVETGRDETTSPIVHSQKYILVDRQSRIRGYYDGLSAEERGKLLGDMRELLAEPAAAVVAAPVGQSDEPSIDDLSPSTDDLRVADTEQAGPEITKSPSTPVTEVFVPEDVRNPEWLSGRAAAQLATRGQFDVFHDFQFSDQRESSGIQFKQEVVEDVKRLFKQAHYDHGAGIAVADVDGDDKLDIYFVSQMGNCELWRNQGGGRFEIMPQPLLAMEGEVAVGASFADIDNDGDADLYVTTVRGGNRLLENDGSGQFTDVTKRAGLAHFAHCSGSVFFDYDRDGYLDLLLTNVGVYTTDDVGPGGYFLAHNAAFAGHLRPERAEENILFRNLGDGRFENVNEQLGFRDSSWCGDATPLDANQDGWPDIYLLSMQGHDEYYENVEGKRFVKKSREVFPQTPWGAMGIEVFDYDRDGQFDIYITDMHTDMVELMEPHEEKLKMRKNYPPRLLMTDGNHVLGNALFRCEGPNRFTEVSDALGAENYWPWGISVADVNADGYEDVFVASSMNYPFRYGINSLLLNNRGKKFLDSEFILGIEPRRYGTALPWFELDASGRDSQHERAKGLSGKVVVWGAAGTRSSVVFDLDQDGDLDIVTNDFGGHPMVLVSNLSEKKAINYLEVELEGKTSNRDGLGAIVEVRVNGGKLLDVHDGKSGYLSQSRKPLYFGLGEATQVEGVMVKWPSGTTQTLGADIKANQKIRITERASN